jgi:hypothetical protein
MVLLIGLAAFLLDGFLDMMFSDVNRKVSDVNSFFSDVKPKKSD